MRNHIRAARYLYKITEDVPSSPAGFSSTWWESEPTAEPKMLQEPKPIPAPKSYNNTFRKLFPEDIASLEKELPETFAYYLESLEYTLSRIRELSPKDWLYLWEKNSEKTLDDFIKDQVWRITTNPSEFIELSDESGPIYSYHIYDFNKRVENFFSKIIEYMILKAQSENS